MDMRFGTWNVKILCRAGSLKTVASESPKYNFDVVAAQDVRWDEGGTQPADDCTFLCGNGNVNNRLEASLYIKESGQWLRGYNLLMMA
jgi:hypothetical protein